MRFKPTRMTVALASVFGLLSIASGVQAQSLERVEITGSSLKRSIESETSLPVTVISRDEITKSGVENLEQLVSRISSTASTGAARTSDLAGLASYGQSSVSMRGLGQQRTLVLLNGKRLADFAGTGLGVDINAIPLFAIERVEVLRDGASSVYGSDAVAGVINFILRPSFTGVEISATLSTPTTSGGGQNQKVAILAGVGNLDADGFNIMGGLSLEKSKALKASDRSFASSGNQPPYFQNAATPSGRIEGAWIPGQSLAANSRNATTNPFGYSSSGYGNPMAPNNCGTINMFPVAAKGGVGGAFNNCNFDSAPYVGLFPDSELTTAYVSGKLKINGDHQLYGEALFSRNKVTEAYQPSPVRVAFLSTDSAFTGSGVDPALLVRPSNPVYSSIIRPYLVANGLTAMDGKPIAVSLRTFLTGPRTEQDTNDQTRFVGGMKGLISGWDYDVSARLASSKTSGMVTDGYFSQLSLARTLNSVDWNPWAAGGVQDPAVTQALQSAKYVGPTVGAKYTTNSVDGVISKSIYQLDGGDVQLALGAQARQEKYKVDVPDILGQGDIAGLGGATLPVDASRSAVALFAEMNMPFTRQWEVNASGRYDRYSDVGSSANGKLSTQWRAAKEVLLRGSLGTGFRAPSLIELHQAQTTGVTEQFIDPAHASDGLIQATSIYGGNAQLKPEKSKQAALGFVLAPAKAWTIGVDVFDITIDDYIIKPAALAMVNANRAGKPLYGAGDVTFAPDGTVDTVNQTYQNAASAHIQGIDLNVNWSDKFPDGRLTVDLTGSYMMKFDLATLAGTQDSVGTIIQPNGAPLDIASLGVIPRWRHVLAATWAANGWAFTIAQNYTSGYQDANDLDGNAHMISALSLYDMQVGYTGIKGLNLAFGVKNILDTKPPLFIGNGSSFQYGYDPTMYDPRARTVYLKGAYKF